MSDKLTSIDLADAQLQGFKHALCENNIISLVSAMGLKKEEWEELKKCYNTYYLNETDISDIDTFFSAEKCPECLRKTSSEELKMFGGFCENCAE